MNHRVRSSDLANGGLLGGLAPGAAPNYPSRASSWYLFRLECRISITVYNSYTVTIVHIEGTSTSTPIIEEAKAAKQVYDLNSEEMVHYQSHH